jgi:hypothetical protein
LGRDLGVLGSSWPADDEPDDGFEPADALAAGAFDDAD